MLFMIYAHIIVTPTLNDISLGLTYANRLPIYGLYSLISVSRVCDLCSISLVLELLPSTKSGQNESRTSDSKATRPGQIGMAATFLWQRLRLRQAPEEEETTYGQPISIS